MFPNSVNIASYSFLTTRGKSEGGLSGFLEIDAAVPFTIKHINLYSRRSSNRSVMHELAIGAAGFERVILPKYIVHSDFKENGLSAATVSLGINIPKGERLSVRGAMQTTGYYDRAYSPNINAFSESYGPSEGVHTYTDYGVDSAYNGVSVDAGLVAHTKGAWVELTASPAVTKTHPCFFISVSSDNYLSGNPEAHGVIDIAIGEPGTQVPIYENHPLRYRYDRFQETTDQIVPVSIPPGQRLWVRAQANRTDSFRLFRVALYGAN